MIYQFEQPFVIDSSKYQSAFGEAAVTSYREGVRQTLNWYRAQAQSGPNEQHQSHPNKTGWKHSHT
jgi:secreted protein with Ig-like and vWFA domain